VPLEIDGSSSETVRVPAEIIVGRGRSIVVRVEGDGFLDEQVRDGDFLVVEQRDAPRDGETVLAVVDGIRTVLGGFRREGTAIRLMPAAATRESAPLDAMRVAIQGVVVSLIRRY
jgi:SOS-response transcriptional repressor LexA